MVAVGGSKPKNHLHVEVMSDFLAKKRGLNRENRSIEQIQGFLSPMVGRKADVTITGTFIMPVADLPETSLIQRAYIEEGQIKIRALGMMLEIENATVPRFSWRTVDGNRLRVDLATHLSGTIDEDYLDLFFGMIESSFRSYVFAESPDADD